MFVYTIAYQLRVSAVS